MDICKHKTVKYGNLLLWLSTPVLKISQTVHCPPKAEDICSASIVNRPPWRFLTFLTIHVMCFPALALCPSPDESCTSCMSTTISGSHTRSPCCREPPPFSTLITTGHAWVSIHFRSIFNFCSVSGAVLTTSQQTMQYDFVQKALSIQSWQNPRSQVVNAPQSVLLWSNFFIQEC